MRVVIFTKDGRLMPFRGRYKDGAIQIASLGIPSRMPFHWRSPPEFTYVDKDSDIIEIKRADVMAKHRNFVIMCREVSQPVADLFVSVTVNLPKGFSGLRPMEVAENPKGIFYDYSFPKGDSPYFGVRGFLLVHDEQHIRLVSYSPSARNVVRTTYQNQYGTLAQVSHEVFTDIGMFFGNRAAGEPQTAEVPAIVNTQS